jgi:phosphoserine phosphatase
MSTHIERQSLSAPDRPRSWPPFRHVFFDCDSTLTSVEGIDELADMAGKGREVRAMTDAAMGGASDLASIYRQRLELINPSRRQVLGLTRVYRRHVVEDAQLVVGALQALGTEVYVISGGLLEPVRAFASTLGVGADHVRAVTICYDRLAGDWWRGTGQETGLDDRYLSVGAEPLTASDGKAGIIREFVGTGDDRSLLVGDGASDLAAAPAVDLFVGFGGVVRRPMVEAAARAYIPSAGLAPVLVLATGPSLWPRLAGTQYQEVLDRGLRQVAEGAVTFTDARLESEFGAALAGASSGGPR